jgi:hypothetical protein
MEERWPNFFIVGAPLCGTTSLYWYLRQHPKVFMPIRKEPYYFNPNTRESYVGSEPPIRLEKDYLRLFEGVRDEIAIGEASTSYLIDPACAKRIHDALPHSKIIISLRDPVERTFSAYLSHVTLGLKSSFAEFIKTNLSEHESGKWDGSNQITPSFYYQSVKRYLDVFGKENVKVLIFEEFTHDIKKTVRDLLNFLGIPDDHFVFNEEPVGSYATPRNTVAKFIMSNIKLRRLTAHIIPMETRQKLGNKYLLKQDERPQMLPTDREFLENLFHDDASNLCILLNKSLPWPLLKR